MAWPVRSTDCFQSSLDDSSECFKIDDFKTG